MPWFLGFVLKIWLKSLGTFILGSWIPVDFGLYKTCNERYNESSRGNHPQMALIQVSEIL